MLFKYLELFRSLSVVIDMGYMGNDDFLEMCRF